MSWCEKSAYVGSDTPLPRSVAENYTESKTDSLRLSPRMKKLLYLVNWGNLRLALPTAPLSSED